jgi:hypothetical protein
MDHLHAYQPIKKPRSFERGFVKGDELRSLKFPDQESFPSGSSEKGAS